MPELIEQGCTSIKLYLTYEGLKLDDYEVLTVLELARREGVMVMVHAENDACIRWLTDRLLESRKTALRYHVTAASGNRRARGDVQGHQFRGADRDADPDRPCVLGRRGRGNPPRPGAWLADLCARPARNICFCRPEDIDTADMSGAKCVCTPPPRERSNQPRMWRGLLDGTLGGVFFGPLALELCRQDLGRPEHALHRRAERHPGNRDAAAAVFLGHATRRPARP